MTVSYAKRRKQMADYINRDSVIELSREYYSPALREEAVPVRAIKNIPSADVVEVRHGKWIVSEDDNNVFGCSECYQFIFLAKGSAKPNFCPNCGAYMRGGT